jgi:hypothetical protein
MNSGIAALAIRVRIAARAAVSGSFTDQAWQA